MSIQRGAGVLCHISSLPGQYGIGTLGSQAHAFAKLLHKAGVKYWQILPLVQTGYGDSPYQSVSSDSFNPYFIDLETLGKQKLLTKEELKDARCDTLDYARLYETRYPLLRKAFSRFFFDDPAFREFIKSGRAEEYALFMTAKTVYGDRFCDWSEELRSHTPDALEKLRTLHHEEYLFWQFLQYEFDLQWTALKEQCHRYGIRIIGDIPLYVAYDSADVWAHAELFKLDKTLKCTKVAGVPPDYFSETGQLWGNPIYNWKAHEKEGFLWWKNRFKRAFEIYDIVRIDHFRGIDRYYEIDADAEDARSGEWKDGPKEKLFRDVRGEFIAEDLGFIDDGVRTLLDRTGFPGMKVLLFAFDGNEENPYLPHCYGENCVAYTGTHDNDTVTGYCKNLLPDEFILFRSRVALEMQALGLKEPLGNHSAEMAQGLVRLCLGSPANLAIAPIQDILSLDNDSRMNTPGTKEGNWQFRLNKIPSGGEIKYFKKAIKKYRR